MGHGRRICIIGGGAAGFFAAITAAEADPTAAVTILEAGREPLRKVRISGGGRCNVSNACSDPRELVTCYPRGGRELRGPLTRFGTVAMQAWLRDRGVVLKEEDHGRLFPISDDSATIVDLLRDSARRAGVELKTDSPVQAIDRQGDGLQIRLGNGQLAADAVLLATGSAPAGWRLAASLGAELVPPAPSLFTFKIPNPALHALAGISCADAAIELQVGSERFRQRGPLLITHWGLSGPAVLWCSAWAARALQDAAYRAEVSVRWLASWDQKRMRAWCDEQRRQRGKAQVATLAPPDVPLRLWQWLVDRAGIGKTTWAALARAQQDRLIEACCDCQLPVQGKTTFKEEFVTAGGVALAGVDFRRMELKACPGLHLAGEVLDIDAITGGYNFQAAWTTGWVAAQAMTGH